MRWTILILLVLCVSCATTLPESNAERQAIISALERYEPGEVLQAKVKARSNYATVHYTFHPHGLAQLEWVPCKATLVKTNSLWIVQSVKDDWPWYNKVFGVK